MRVLITGGAGFLGSHLCDTMIARGDSVMCVDDLSTGRLDNIRHLIGQRAFSFAKSDVSAGFQVPGPFDAVAHLASPASPVAYLRRPLQTLATGSVGTENLIRLALQNDARFVLASTSEVYGDPLTHPQPEDYWGNVNPIGPRSVYDEAKRFAEALTFACRRELHLNAGVVRIFNTYGPRLRADDGRIVTNFIVQALSGQPLTVYGDGSQTRSFCYVDDLVRAMVAMLDSSVEGPVNLGNPQEISVIEFARLVLRVTGSSSPIEHRPLPVDDPVRRCPVINRANELLSWKPEIDLDEGIRRTTDWFRSHPEHLEYRSSRSTAGSG